MPGILWEGGVEFKYLSAGRYQINLIQYYDELQTLNRNPDLSLRVYIFRNGDNQIMSIHRLVRTSQTTVPYTNTACVSSLLSTSRILYSTIVSLNPEEYASPEGYYIKWERCCRNKFNQEYC